MATIGGVDNSQLYTETTADIRATEKGIYALSYVADSYGTASIDFLIGGKYWPVEEMAEATHKIITIPRLTTFRVTITGGTGAMVRLTELDWHRA